MYCTLYGPDGRCIAAGTGDAIRAAARLLFGHTNIYNPLERDLFDAMSERIREDMDREVMGEPDSIAGVGPATNG